MISGSWPYHEYLSIQPEIAAAEPYCTLLEVSESIALHRDLSALFHDLAQRLHRVVSFDYLNLLLYEPSRNTMRLHILETSGPPTAVEAGLETALDEGPAGMVWQTQTPWVAADIEPETRFPKIISMLKDNGVRSVAVLPLTTAQRRLGALGFGSRDANAYAESHLDFLRQIAAQVAVAVDNALNYEAAQNLQRQLARERDRLRAVLDATNALVSNLQMSELFHSISTAVQRVTPHDYASLVLADAGCGVHRIHAVRNDGAGLVEREITGPVEGSPAGEAMATRQALRIDRLETSRFPHPFTMELLAEGLRSCISVPLVRGERLLGALNVASARESAYTQDDVDLLAQIGNEVAIAVENALAYRQIAELTDKLAKEKDYLEDEIRTEYNFEEIVGDSPALRSVLRDVETVAPTDSSVLIGGESGTGKELIARAIHNLGSRRERTFVKVNCAAIPTGLLESELFGHEKGAFTGAISQKLGRFELADGGTLFLDEIGDIPLELQPKLLRVLQEREFERLGGTRTIHVNVRVVTATNRDLVRMVAAREFREDLYYRINVFPILLPPLRDRREDIPQLVRYFVQKYAKRMNRRIETIPPDAMDALVSAAWPGNVRELENFIERAVILSAGRALEVPVAALRPDAGHQGTPVATMEEAERQHILRALQETGWTVGGPKGAAVRLGMKRTTLQSRMQKLGIRR